MVCAAGACGFSYNSEKRKCLKHETHAEFTECVRRLRLVGKTRRLINKTSSTKQDFSISSAISGFLATRFFQLFF